MTILITETNARGRGRLDVPHADHQSCAHRGLSVQGGQRGSERLCPHAAETEAIQLRLRQPPQLITQLVGSVVIQEVE